MRPPPNTTPAAFEATRFELAEEPAEGQIPVLAVRGELDVFTAPELRMRLAEQIARRPAGVVVDLAECGFLDASGCRVLLLAARRLAAAGGCLALVEPAGAAARTFAVMGLADLFPVAATRGEAAAMAQGPEADRRRNRLLL